VQIADIPIGNGAPLALIAGVNVLESESDAIASAVRVQEIAEQHGFPIVFKASVDKANRSNLRSYRGPGFDEGLRILARVKAETGLPVTTDVHEPPQAKLAAGVVDCLQVPAFLCRQTDLLLACAATGLPVHVKKGQFIAPRDMRHAVEKVRSVSNAGVMLCERGTSFGYNDLVVDMRGLVQMRRFAPVCFDATHSVQHPGAAGDASDGDRQMVAPLARAAVAVGIDAIFIETHPEPDHALCDGPSQISYASFERLLVEVREIDSALRSRVEPAL